MEIDAQSHLAAIVESSDDAIISKNLDGIITSWNRASERTFGYRADEIIGHSVLRLIPPELHSEEPLIIKKIKAGEWIEHYETRRVCKDGKVIEVSLTISPIRDASGRVIGASKIARDITERRLLDQARFRLAAIVESSNDAIVAKDLNGIITDWNQAATKMFGYTASEIVGQSILMLIPPDLHHEETFILNTIRGGGRVDHFETTRVRKGGERIHVSLAISPIRDAHGKVIGVSKIARDISERKRNEKMLRESEKLAATGRMAAMIAHEINNPLEAITNLSYLLTTSNLTGEAHTYAQLLLSEVSRVSSITKQTLSFYRDTGQPTDVRLDELLENTLDLHRSKIAQKQLQIHKRFTSQGVVRGFASELRQVFANLLVNAIDAVPERGELHLRIKHLSDGDVSYPGALLVTIADSGCGISPEVRSHIFEPFFTTKAGSGTGLGLWVSNGIVRKHGGKILVHSKTGPRRSGTVFGVTLPLNADAQARVDYRVEEIPTGS
jgi:PAS domain S-box-containing protein